MLKSGNTHEIFVKNMIEISSTQLLKIWKSAIFTGTGTPPRILKSEEQIVDIVKNTKGAIGYIDSSTTCEGVKVY